MPRKGSALTGRCVPTRLPVLPVAACRAVQTFAVSCSIAQNGMMKLTTLVSNRKRSSLAC